MNIAITGHTSGLGKSFFDICNAKGHLTLGFSRSNGYDLRDYSAVTRMLDQVKDFDVFINNAKPDYAQAQILYRLTRLWSAGTIVSIGSAIIDNPPDWTDSFLLEYSTQKHALAHANKALTKISNCKLILLNPGHLGQNTDQYAMSALNTLEL